VGELEVMTAGAVTCEEKKLESLAVSLCDVFEEII
jgi:hypothetical protein